ncbi:MAG: DUF4982 domain-containing protein [Ignavibacteria bacterium]|jgi:hypothetical protein
MCEKEFKKNQFLRSKILLSKLSLIIILIFVFISCSNSDTEVRETKNFGDDWKFNLGEISKGYEPSLDDSKWRNLNLPHDWSIEGEFSEDHPAGPGGGALPGGIGWYRKSFLMPESKKEQLVFIEFDGVYENSEIWINGYYLGKRPNGYISFRHELTPYLNYGDDANLLAVKVDNSNQPNSRWYTGSGIYRNVRLVTTGKIYVDNWGTYVTTPEVNKTSATALIKTKVKNGSGNDASISMVSTVIDDKGNKVAETEMNDTIQNEKTKEFVQEVSVDNPSLWSVESPSLYKVLATVKSGALDVIGFNYGHEKYTEIPGVYPGMPFIATETESSLHTRGSYDMPSDSIRRWPPRWDLPLLDGNPDHSCSSYDNCSTPWGSTHEETWRVINKFNFVSGMFTWTGFDYLGEPTPYTWPARSSYFGLIDLAGFPKEAYYFYKSEWTDEPVLHLFPHWNWDKGNIIDVWAYTNCDEVELFLNDEFLGIKKKSEDIFHLTWQLKFASGTLKAVARSNGKEILTKEIKTAGEPAKIKLEADRNIISADGKDLSFVTVKILDKDGNLVPDADNLVNFSISGSGKIAAVDNGLQTSHKSFKTNYRKAFNGLCLAVIQSNKEEGKIILTAESDDLDKEKIIIKTK